MIYSRGNAAKEWILQDIHQRIGSSPVRILDLACGSGWIWKSFLNDHPGVHVVGMDTDTVALTKGRTENAGVTNLELREHDAQKPIESGVFDIIVALSAIEHVVDRPAFVKTAWDALRPGGIVYFNYDAGHFRSSNIKERVMVPVSQLLAALGYEKPYMKVVDDAEFAQMCEARGFRITNVTKHNLHPLKGFMRGANDDAITAWLEFEACLRSLYPTDKLDRIMWSTIVTAEKV